MFRPFHRSTSLLLPLAALVLFTSSRMSTLDPANAPLSPTTPPCDSAAVVEIGHQAILSKLGASMDSFKPFVATKSKGQWSVHARNQKGIKGPVALISMDSCAVITVVYTL